MGPSVPTTRAQEPEAVSEEEQQAISVRARSNLADEGQRENTRRDRAQWLQRLTRVEMRAEDKSVDVLRYQAQVQQAVLAMEQPVEEAP